MTTILSSNEPLIVALDATGSMQVAHDPADPATRAQYAQERLRDLFERLPRETQVTLVAFGHDVYVIGTDLTGQQALELVNGVAPNAAVSNTGKVVEWALTEFLRGQQRATLLIVTDGPPDDTARWEAWTHYNALQGNPLAIHVLTLGDVDDEAAWNLRGDRHSIGKLADNELMLGKPASTPPDGSDPAKADTEPPSVAPPTPKHIEVDVSGGHPIESFTSYEPGPKPGTKPSAAPKAKAKGGKHE